MKKFQAEITGFFTGVGVANLAGAGVFASTTGYLGYKAGLGPHHVVSLWGWLVWL